MSEITSDDIERYTRLLERDPGSRVFAPLAEAFRKANRHQEALDIARAGVERHPTYASGRVALARAQLSLEQYEDAARELDQAIVHAPENALAYRLLGEARRNLGQHEAAFEAFARALALNPEDGEAREAVAILEEEALAAVAPEHPPPALEEAPEPAAQAFFEDVQPAADEVALTDEIAGHEQDEELPEPAGDASAGMGGAAELDLALEPINESDVWPGDPDTPLEGTHAQAAAEPETSLPEAGPVFGPGAVSGFGGSKHESVTPAELGEEGGGEAMDYPVDAVEPAHPDEALTGGGDVPLERFLDDLDIGQSSLAPEARESAPAGPSGEEAPPAPAGQVEAEEMLAPEKEVPPEERVPAGSAIPLDGRVEELADQYRDLGHPHRARALYRALLDGNPMNLEARRKLEELGEDLQPPVPVPPPHDQMVRLKVEENIDSLNRWLANIKKGAAR